MVEGLAVFRDRFRGLDDCYVLIGGTACDLWMGERALDFRATKDLDMVLVVEALRPEFFKVFWRFVKDAGYEGFGGGQEPRNFYRFKKPAQAGFPWMIELFSRRALDLPADVRLSPVPAGEDLSSLSAILLDDDYYRLVLDSRTTIDGISTVPAGCLIALKARAWLDLSNRKAAGEVDVAEADIKKHRNDVFRLLVTLAPADRVQVPEAARVHLRQFVAKFPAGATEWPAIRQAVKNLPEPAAILGQLSEVFMLDVG
jgi:hypothetical protein